eukprot:TRINITY_DN13192_c0_g1_i6.p1 TRINITY_DN13192_c0_g1~~TRINITY_DN13192_c0_g1_i6.p1  ORF type:complete len:293 (-),score=53.68 TRINITY_DN13192_c0_g1_i6:1167-2045(-)
MLISAGQQWHLWQRGQCRWASSRAAVLHRDKDNKQNSRRLAQVISQSRSVEDVLRLAASTPPTHFDHVHATACLHRTAKLWRKASASEETAKALASLFQRLAIFLEQPGLIDVTAVTINTWSVAKLGDAASPGMRQVLPGLFTEAQNHLREMPAKGLANLAWSLATLLVHGEVADAGSRRNRVVLMLAEEALHRMPEFAPQGLANIHWAFTHLQGVGGQNFVTLRHALAEEAMRRIKELQAQDLASIAWSFATSLISTPSLAEALSQEASKKLSHFSPRHLTNLAWALATMR